MGLDVGLVQLKELIDRFESPRMKASLEQVARDKEVAALVAQAIADNFTQEGPGWPALAPNTIRYSTAKKLRKMLKKMTDDQIRHNERGSRLIGSDKVAFRQILRKTGLLMKTVTTPGYVGNSNKISGKNIYRVNGTMLTWGTDLKYAEIHNKGGSITVGKKNKKTIKIPQREFLVVREEWKQKIFDYITLQAIAIIDKEIGGGKK